MKYCQNNHLLEQRSITPNDPNYNLQWAPSKLDLPDAWDDFFTGGSTSNGHDIVLAVIDGGFDLDHEDLDFITNSGETPNDGRDNDRNGYIDDVDGWNTINQTDNISEKDHGTHVSGVAGAKGNNSIGISGVNWDIAIVPIVITKISIPESHVVEAYDYALYVRAKYNETNGSLGAYIVATNSSFGINNADPANFPIWCAMYDALGAEGILSVGATSNNNVNVDNVGDIPTTCTSDYFIAVTSTNTSDQIASRGYGPISVDL